MNFGTFYLDKEKDIAVDLTMEDGHLLYVLRTPNHHTGNLISNLARMCGLPVSLDDAGLKVIRGEIPCYVDGQNHLVYIFRMGNTKMANIYPDGTVEMKASIPAISKTLMSQTKDYRLGISKTLVKTYIRRESKFTTDLHTHMNGNLEPEILIALGIHHEIRYPLYYIRKLELHCTEKQEAFLAAEREKAALALMAEGCSLQGRYLQRRIDDRTYINFADLILGNPQWADANIERIRNSLTVPKDGQAVFANLEKVYLYRYVFTKGVPCETGAEGLDAGCISNEAVRGALRQMERDRQNPDFAENTIFEDKLLWIARTYRDHGIDYVEISDTTLVKRTASVEMLCQAHAVLPAVLRETGVMIRFLAGIRRIPLTIVRDQITPNDYLAENLKVLRALALDPYVAGADIIGEEINDILELKPVIRELVRIADEVPGFVIRIHAGENDSLRDNVANSIACVTESLAPGQEMPALRIGHGLYTSNLQSAKGKKLLEELRQRRVVLEFQITSNVRLNNLSILEHHPLKQYLKQGIACVQGTDGGALYGTDSIDEELALEKLLELTPEELQQMREWDARLDALGHEVFEQKQKAFEQLRAETEIGAFLRGRMDRMDRDFDELWKSDRLLETAQVLAGQIVPFPRDGIPVILCGGSFNNSQHRTRMTEEYQRLIREILDTALPGSLFFVVGNRLCAYEQELLRQNQGRFPVYAVVPNWISETERRRLLGSGVRICPSIESSEMGLYKSFAYEIFKRRRSVLLALDGNSPALNLMQEAKNGRYKCRVYVNPHAKNLLAKAETLKGYVTLLSEDGAWRERLFQDLGCPAETAKPDVDTSAETRL